MKRVIGIRHICFITVGLAAASFSAFAGKPGGQKPPPPPPPPPAPATYVYTALHYPPFLRINSAGQLAGTAEGAVIVLPQDTNGDGVPDLYWRDSNLDGYNDLDVNLGLPAGYGATLPEDCWPRGMALNDAGQVLVDFTITIPVEVEPGIWEYQLICVLGVVTPKDMNFDGQKEWFWPDGAGANALMTTLAFLEGDESTTPTAINNRGQVLTDIGPDSGPYNFAVFDSVDTDSDGVGDSWFADANGDGVNDLYTDLGSALTSMGVLTKVRATGINDAGQITGTIPWPESSTSGDPFMLNPKVDSLTGRQVWFEDLNGDGANDLIEKMPLLGNYLGFASGLTSGGMAVGGVRISSSAWHATLWQPSATGMTITDLGLFGSMTTTTASGVNDLLQVVGSGTSAQPKNSRVLGQSPFLWQNGVMKDLRPMLDKAASLTTTELYPNAINRRGTIVGHTSYGGWVAVPVAPNP